MKIIQVSEIVSNVDHPLWWLVSRENFAMDILSCVVAPYQDLDGVP